MAGGSSTYPVGSWFLLLASVWGRPGAGLLKRACNSMSKLRRAFEVLGIAPSGFGCALCHQGGAELQILHGRYVSLWHCDCAEEFFGAPVEPTKLKVAAALDRK
jgi:hypothetical protein